MVFTAVHASYQRGLALACLLLAIAAGGCAAVERTTAETAVISGSSGRKLPEDLRPAVLVDIDGQRIATGQRAVVVAPGPHRITVAPVVAGPEQQVPGPEYLISRFPNRPLQLQAEAGRVYVVALRFTEPLNLGDLSGAWEAILFESLGAAAAPVQSTP